MLESMETNKLYKNQRKLERSEQSLKENQKQYSTAEERLSAAERELAQVESDLVQTQFKARNRVRQIFKKQRRGMFQLLLSTTDMNTFLDRIYYQNVITKKDKKLILFPRRIRCGYGIRAALCVIIQLEGCHILITLALDDEILCQRIAVQRIGDGALRIGIPSAGDDDPARGLDVYKRQLYGGSVWRFEWRRCD